ncbi:MAG TPA: GTPase, partial [Candidatus Nanoarchaeia archaeon]|nr:GTPase [Candidatus Nanoarchaeia archaeon]
RRETTNPNRLFRSKKIEQARVETMGKSLANALEMIGKSFPRFDALAPFYQELVRATVDYEQLKKSLGAVNWAKLQVKGLTEKYLEDIKRTMRAETVNKVRAAFSGRTSSVLKQIKDNLSYLEEVRKTMKGYPTLKTSVKTIVIAGMPNVGKSTLLAQLTGSKPQVAPYPFTTQRLNFGYDKDGNQYVDTPGLLDRPLEKRNRIERQAILALKHLANLIVFVIDPSEGCGYPINDQRSLLEETKKVFDLPILVAANKTDTGAQFKEAIAISAKEGTGLDELRKAISVSLLVKSR